MAFPAAILLLATYLLAVSARRFHLPEDPFTFPKYRVTFLNSLPLVNDTAERWLKHGLQGGMLEFMDQPWKDSVPSSSPTKEIDSGVAEDTPHQHNVTPKPSLERIKMGPNSTFLCYIPAPLEPPRAEPVAEEAELSPIRGWQLLQPLAGSCLYYRHGWFTYSYCHNQEIRQFRELSQPPQGPGGYKIQEDPSWNAYTLGKAPPTPQPGVDLTVAEQNAVAANLELAKGAGSRYLVQRWGDGTICDMTGKRREVEVQFHCSMELSDHIALVKETKICSYLVVIHTPRLCTEPGFRNPFEVQEEALIRCREVVPNGSLDDPVQVERYKALPPESSHPAKFSRPQRVISPPPSSPLTPKGSKKDMTDTFQDLFQKALANMGGVGDDTKVVVQKAMDNGEITFEVLNDDIDFDDDALQESLSKIFKAAGWDLKDDKKESKESGKKKKQEDEEVGWVDRDEL